MRGAFCLEFLTKLMDNSEQLIFSAKATFDEFVNSNRIKQEGEFSKLGDRQFASIIDEAEYWRKNIAVFRSSL